MTTILNLNLNHRNNIQDKFNELIIGQKEWAQIPLKKRIECIQRFSKLLLDNKEDLAITLTKDMGKPIRESRNEIDGARNRIQYFIDHSQTWLSPEMVHKTDQVEEILTYEPLGVIANISAWNYPYLVGVNVFIPALIAGNAVFYKPSEHALETGKKIEELLYKAGIPKNVFTAVLGDGSAGKRLLELPLNGFFFTGSYNTGASIAKQIGPRMVPMGFELGGKDPLYVTNEVADIRAVAQAAVEGCFYNNGQSCCAVERIYVAKQVYARFLSAFIEETQKLKMGDPLLETTDLGYLARAEQVEVLNAQIRDATGKGALLLLGGIQQKMAQPYFEPTVLVNVDHTMSLMREETFGPVIGIQKVQNDEEAIRLMGDTEYGLTASVYSSNIPRAKEILRKLDVGSGLINCCDRVTAYLPWSGRKHSGLGSTLSYLGILSFCKPKGYQIKPG